MARTKIKIDAGGIVGPRQLGTMNGTTISVSTTRRTDPSSVPAIRRLPHLRPPIHHVANRITEITDAGITEVVVFHATNEELHKYEPNLPFAVVGDPDKVLYQEFGVESSPRAILHGGFLRAAPKVLSNFRADGKNRRKPPSSPNGGKSGLPADFLIDRDGRVLAAKFGDHAYDQWTVDQLLDLSA